MPYPVSPDAGVPEHQPDRPASGQFQPGGQPQPGPFRTNQPQPRPAPADHPRSGQFATRAQSRHLPPGPGRPAADPSRSDDDGKGRRTGGRRDWIWSVVAFLVAAGVIGGVGFHFFGPDATEESTASWAVDACAGPDPTAADAGAATDTYRPLACDDAEATVTVLDIQDAVSIGQAHCPTGTDIVFQKDGHAGGATQAVCARNLSDDHPGDPGMGGGQLMTGDCVTEDGREAKCSSKDTREVVGLTIGTSKCPDGTADRIKLGFDAQRSYETICLGK
ncbi:hypothetical protein APR04_001391 [Promicromonospora umidemergens]|nr:hypothetical protein [Promicromonospora umidemergens]MCP2282493.1 hypothetical protein [Promicromonospora umidemergens]